MNGTDIGNALALNILADQRIDTTLAMIKVAAIVLAAGGAVWVFMMLRKGF